jgi:NAD(P)-dependent dehydrogenase (short-subunit alcohol dehydrogenase family)
VARWISEFVEDVTAGRPLGAHARHDPTDRRPFAGKLALVTGAGSGIGRATTFAFAEAGAEVVAVDRDANTAERTAELARVLGARAHAEVVDVSDAAAMDELAKRVAADYGVVDILVNNAGIGAAGAFLDSTVDDWRRTLDVNLWGVIHGCRAFAQQMVERGEGGHIVNVASAAAFQPSKSLPVYSTSKAAVLMLSECLRAELAGHTIGVSAICPGLVNTNITQTTTWAGRSDDEQAAMRQRTSKLYDRRNFRPERVADAILAAVQDNRAVVPVTVEAKAALAMQRFAPALLRRLARVGGLS